jgi:hypothetical protein
MRKNEVELASTLCSSSFNQPNTARLLQEPVWAFVIAKAMDFQVVLLIGLLFGLV